MPPPLTGFRTKYDVALQEKWCPSCLHLIRTQYREGFGVESNVAANGCECKTGYEPAYACYATGKKTCPGFPNCTNRPELCCTTSDTCNPRPSWPPQPPPPPCGYGYRPTYCVKSPARAAQ